MESEQSRWKNEEVVVLYDPVLCHPLAHSLELSGGVVPGVQLAVTWLWLQGLAQGTNAHLREGRYYVRVLSRMQQQVDNPHHNLARLNAAPSGANGWRPTGVGKWMRDGRWRAIWRWR